MRVICLSCARPSPSFSGTSLDIVTKEPLAELYSGSCLGPLFGNIINLMMSSIKPKNGGNNKYLFLCLLEVINKLNEDTKDPGSSRHLLRLLRRPGILLLLKHRTMIREDWAALMTCKEKSLVGGKQRHEQKNTKGHLHWIRWLCPCPIKYYIAPWRSVESQRSSSSSAICRKKGRT